MFLRTYLSRPLSCFQILSFNHSPYLHITALKSYIHPLIHHTHSNSKPKSKHVSSPSSDHHHLLPPLSSPNGFGGLERHLFRVWFLYLQHTLEIEIEANKGSFSTSQHPSSRISSTRSSSTSTSKPSTGNLQGGSGSRPSAEFAPMFVLMFVFTLGGYLLGY